MQLPIGEKKKATNILEMNIDEPLNSQKSTDLLNKLKVNPGINTIWLSSQIPGAIITTEFSNRLAEVLKKTLQITKVVYKNCDIEADAHLAIEKEISINRRSKKQNLSAFTMSVSTSSMNPTSMKLAQKLEMELASGKVKKVILTLDFDFISADSLDFLIDLCDQFPEITVLNFNFDIKSHGDVVNVKNRLKKLLSKFESLSITFSSINYLSNSFLLSLLANSEKLKKLTLTNITLNTEIALALTDFLSQTNRLTELCITSDPHSVHNVKLSLENNTNIECLTLEGVYSLETLDNVLSSLVAHPNIRSVAFDRYVHPESLEKVCKLVQTNKSIECLKLPNTPLNEVNTILFFQMLQVNNNLRKITITPYEMTTRCTNALLKVLEHNHTLGALQLGSSDSANQYIQIHNSELITLKDRFPERCFIRKLVLPLQYHSNSTDAYFEFIKTVVCRSPMLTNLVLNEPGPSERFTDSITFFGRFKLSRRDLSSGSRSILSSYTARNKVVNAIETAEKISKLAQTDNELDKELRTNAKALLSNELISFEQTQLEINANIILGQLYLASKNHVKAYSHFRQYSFEPKTSAAILMMLFGEDDQSFIELASTIESFKFSNLELQQFYLALISYCDVNDKEIFRILSFILKTLNKMPGLDSTILKDKYNAALPIRHNIIIEVTESVLNDYAAEEELALRKILGDSRLHYYDLFRLLRTHPLVKEVLKNGFGTFEVVCFEDLIINYINPKTVYNPSDTWENLYSDYVNGKFYSMGSNNDIDTVSALTTKLYTFFDHLYLSNEVKEDAVKKDDTLNILSKLAEVGMLPWLDTFIASAHVQKGDTNKAIEFYLSAAEKGDFSALKKLKNAATRFEPWAMRVLTSPAYLTKYPELNLFLAQCCQNQGNITDALIFYRIALKIFPTKVIEKLKKFALADNKLALDILREISDKPAHLLIFLGDHAIQHFNIHDAVQYYKLADPSCNIDAFNRLKALVDESRKNGTPVCHEASICIADLYRSEFRRYSSDIRLLELAFNYNYQAANLNHRESIEFLKEVCNHKNVSYTWLYLIAGSMAINNEPQLAKTLLIRAKDNHPIAKLEVKLLTSPPKLGDREKVLDFKNEALCSISLRNYFNSFPSNKSFAQDNIAKNIADHYNKHLTMNANQALTWLREYTSQQSSLDSNLIKGELARMISCAIYVLKNWHQPVLSLAPSNKP